MRALILVAGTALAVAACSQTKTDTVNGSAPADSECGTPNHCLPTTNKD